MLVESLHFVVELGVTLRVYNLDFVDILGIFFFVVECFFGHGSC